jgi:hypothetical protein
MDDERKRDEPTLRVTPATIREGELLVARGPGSGVATKRPAAGYS